MNRHRRHWTRTAVERKFSAALLFVLILTAPALAHPHIWVDATAVVGFDAQGRAAAVSHVWRFDEAYSAWAVQGLDTDGDGVLTEEELQPLADDNMDGLSQYGYFTFGSMGDTEIGFGHPSNARMRFEDGVLILSFTVTVEPPSAMQGQLEIDVGDPEYYAAFTFEGADAVRLEGAPAGCTVDVNLPKEIDSDIAARLFALPPDITVLPPDLRQAARDLDNVVVVDCGTAPAPPAAAGAARQMAEGTLAQSEEIPPPAQSFKPPTASTPFTSPPVEPATRPGAGGLPGWIAAQQQRFYLALTDSLGSLKTEGRAFWTLGLISFLYGIFHAAGPGHGKVVISSYLVARERNISRGIGLSFAAAMMQSLTAVVFVSLAAGVLRLTSFAMSDAAAAMTTGSYVLIAVIGGWLAWRKFAQLWHAHRPSHAHAHGGGHGHHHGGTHGHVDPFVAPRSARGDWREMASVVLAVGLRPCSGALIVLAFALTQGLLPAGIAATFVMGLGTALTVTVLAGFAVTFKDLALRIAKGGHGWIESLVGWAELGAALLVMGFGILLTLASL